MLQLIYHLGSVRINVICVHTNPYSQVHNRQENVKAGINARPRVHGSAIPPIPPYKNGNWIGILLQINPILAVPRTMEQMV